MCKYSEFYRLHSKIWQKYVTKRCKLAFFLLEMSESGEKKFGSLRKHRGRVLSLRVWRCNPVSLFALVQRYYFFSKSNNSMSLAPCEKNPVTP